MPSADKHGVGTVKDVVCTHCQKTVRVGRRALSVFCPHCRKRLILENFTIRSYYAVRDFSTCGDIVVERNGHVVAPIKAGNLTVRGKVQGQVIARGKVSITKTGWLKGGIEASMLRVESGAIVQADLRIGLSPRSCDSS